MVSRGAALTPSGHSARGQLPAPGSALRLPGTPWPCSQQLGVHGLGGLLRAPSCSSGGAIRLLRVPTGQISHRPEALDAGCPSRRAEKQYPSRRQDTEHQAGVPDSHRSHTAPNPLPDPPASALGKSWQVPVLSQDGETGFLAAVPRATAQHLLLSRLQGAQTQAALPKISSPRFPACVAPQRAPTLRGAAGRSQGHPQPRSTGHSSIPPAELRAAFPPSLPQIKISRTETPLPRGPLTRCLAFSPFPPSSFSPVRPLWHRRKAGENHLTATKRSLQANKGSRGVQRAELGSWHRLWDALRWVPRVRTQLE